MIDEQDGDGAGAAAPQGNGFRERQAPYEVPARGIIALPAAMGGAPPPDNNDPPDGKPADPANDATDADDKVADGAAAEAKAEAEAEAAGRRQAAPHDEEPVAPQDGMHAPFEPVTLEALAGIADDQVLAHCLAVSRDGRCDMLTFLGLSGTGKSFLIRRFAKVLDQYECKPLAGNEPIPWDQFPTMGATNKILGFRLVPKKAGSGRRHLVIWDLPGERYEAIHARLFGTGTSVNEQDITNRLPAAGAILALTSAIGFVMPAMRVLNKEHHIAYGDGTTNDPAKRQQQIADTNNLINSLASFRDIVMPLRDAARRHWHDPDALRDMIEATVNPTDPRVPRKLQGRRLDLPAMVLFTRAEEYRDSLSTAKNDWDANPMLHLLQKRPEVVGNFVQQFEHFSWDFISAYAHCQSNTPDDQLPHFGVTDLYEGWLLPAMARGDALLRTSDHDAMLALATEHPALIRYLVD